MIKMNFDDAITDPPISDFMNRNVLKGEADTPIAEVVGEMITHGDGAFVVCENEFPIGVVTERDTLEVLNDILNGRDPATISAQSVMASPLHTLPETSAMSEVIDIMKQRFFRRVPIVDEQNQLSGIVNLVELQRAMNDVLEKRQQDLENAVEARTAELQEANQKLEELSIRDGLTGLLNRRAMTLQLEERYAISNRYGNAYSVILCDIDHFKILNDTLGHLEGDRILREVSNILQNSVRTSDFLYRYGGEEFLIVLPETGEQGALWVAERMRHAVEEARIAHPNSSTGSWTTLSFGVSEAMPFEPEGIEHWTETIGRADRALYRSKEEGRNRVSTEQ